ELGRHLVEVGDRLLVLVAAHPSGREQRGGECYKEGSIPLIHLAHGPSIIARRGLGRKALWLAVEHRAYGSTPHHMLLDDAGELSLLDGVIEHGIARRARQIGRKRARPRTRRRCPLAHEDVGAGLTLAEAALAGELTEPPQAPVRDDAL